ncbi:hypothetical protein RND71_025261 [Anisodus tanguticus]|uniref:Uncharacterized protein n=1 Tax=Anisodus tanguticus TaxID=243964 RepID=A0AAE1VD90_9SOLA|nr:hypothetical protein RND71_025261 [Anisodus tanguticus]
MVFIKKQIHLLLTDYLSDRWTRNATKEKANGPPNETNNLKASTFWFNNIMMHSIGLSEQATRSEKHYQFAHQKLLQLCEELDKLPYESEKDHVPDAQVSEKDHELNSCDQSQNITLLDPPRVATKGRPKSLRMQGALEIWSFHLLMDINFTKNMKKCHGITNTISSITYPVEFSRVYYRGDTVALLVYDITNAKPLIMYVAG